jgi:hypothetical protein
MRPIPGLLAFDPVAPSVFAMTASPGRLGLARESVCGVFQPNWGRHLASGATSPHAADARGPGPRLWRFGWECKGRPIARPQRFEPLITTAVAASTALSAAALWPLHRQTRQPRYVTAFGGSGCRPTTAQY